MVVLNGLLITSTEENKMVLQKAILVNNNLIIKYNDE